MRRWRSSNGAQVRWRQDYRQTTNMEETMTLSIYRPMRLMDAMNRLFDESVLHPYDRPYVADERAYALPLDVIAKDDEYVITAAVPGLEADDLSVEVLGETVTIRGA